MAEAIPVYSLQQSCQCCSSMGVFVLVHGVENQRKSYSNIGDLSCTGMWRCSRYSIDSLMYIIALKFALQIKIEMGVWLPFPECSTHSGWISVGSYILCIYRPLWWVNRPNGTNGHVCEPGELDINSFTWLSPGHICFCPHWQTLFWKFTPSCTCQKP